MDKQNINLIMTELVLLGFSIEMKDGEIKADKKEGKTRFFATVKMINRKTVQIGFSEVSGYSVRVKNKKFRNIQRACNFLWAFTHSNIKKGAKAPTIANDNPPACGQSCQ